jgi:hypothetical protein
MRGLPKSQNQKDILSKFSALILNFPPSTASLQNNKFSRTYAGTVKMAWYGDVRFKQLTITEFLAAEKNK